MTASSKPLRVLVPFLGGWEDEALEGLQRAGHITLYREGFDLRRFPDCCRVAWFDGPRFVDRMVLRYRGRIDAVWSSDEQFGCLISAAIADRLSLPGTRPEAVVRAQHKLLMREALARVMPEATVVATAIPYRLSDARLRQIDVIEEHVRRGGLDWPLFVKPLKATFSVLARRASAADVLVEHLRLSWFDRYVMGRLTRPFETLARQYVELPCPADSLLLEEPLRGHQVNVDGFAMNGEFHLLGVVDEWMYADEVAGAMHFAGFTYPSRLRAGEHDRVVATAIAAMRAVGFDHGQFNVELFVCDDGSIRVIEINPRAAGQFASLYRHVDGLQLELMGMWLMAGRDPREVPRFESRAAVAGSLVFRRFDGGRGTVPTAAARTWLAAEHPRARLWLHPTGKRDVEREYRWLGSHRYAVLNCAAEDFGELQSLGDECGQRLFGTTGPRLYAGRLAAVRKPANTSVL